MPAGPPDSLDALLEKLRHITPMPADDQINPTIFRIYDDLVRRIVRLPDRDPRAIAPLLASLGPGECRGAYGRVIEHVESFGPEVAGPPLVGTLERGTVGARKWSALALGRLAYEPAREALLVAREDRDVAVRSNADLALRMLDATKPREEEDEGYDPLFDGLKI